MRESSRINPLIERLRAVWLSHPDARLGQLLMNSVRDGTHLYYIEDADLLDLVERLYFGNKKEVDTSSKV